MKKLVTMIMVLAISASVSASAQESEKIEKVEVATNALKGNWFVDLGVGALYFNGNFASDMHFGEQLAPSVDINVGKWFTPSIGARVGVHGLYLNTISSTPNFATRDDVDGVNVSNPTWNQDYDQRYYNTNFRADALFNVSNMFWGYKPERIYNLVPYVGVGLMQGYKDNRWTDLAVDFGLLNTFNISKHFNAYVDLSSVFFKNEYTSRAVTRDYSLSATIGLSYKFKNSGWVAAVPTVLYTGISQADYDNVNGKLDAEKAASDELRSELDAQKKAMAKAIKDAEEAANVAAAPVLITFPIGSSKLDKLSMVNLKYYADTINEAGDKKSFTIVGYADKATGSAKRNKTVSYDRANAVYSALVDDFGVAPSKLRLEYEGGVDNMFYNDPALSRSVILSPNK